MNVANLPTLDEARANIVGILNASASKLESIFYLSRYEAPAVGGGASRSGSGAG